MYYCSLSPYFEWSPFPLLSQSHPGRLPISWLVFLLSIESFVEMMSPGFHSAAFLVHLSGFGVAIRRACRHFNFFCVSTQLVMLYVSICSSASSVILFPYSIQSSRLSSWLAVLSSSSSSSNETVLVVFIMCAVFFVSLLAYFIVRNVLFSKSVRLRMTFPFTSVQRISHGSRSLMLHQSPSWRNFDDLADTTLRVASSLVIWWTCCVIVHVSILVVNFSSQSVPSNELVFATHQPM